MSRRVCAALATLLLLDLAGFGTGEASIQSQAPPSRKSTQKKGTKKTQTRAVPPGPVAIERPELLAPFFARLAALPPPGSANAGHDVVRVLHFGDSHVAADYWTGELRRLLQDRFGDAGAGYVMPGRPWRYFRHALVKSPQTARWETAGLGPDPRDGLYGLSGVGLVPGPTEEPAVLEGPFRAFEVQLLSMARGSCATVSVDGTTVFSGTLDEPADCGESPQGCCFLDVSLTETEPWHLAWVSNAELLPEGPHRLEVRGSCGGAIRLLGADLTSDRSGVLVDTLGINGAEISSLRKWRPGLPGRLVAHAAPSLAVVSYGTNDMGRGDFVFEDYRAECVETLSALRREAPDVPILVTGPIDRAARGRKTSRRLIDTNEELVIRALREAAAQTGCAFWDARAAMGGNGAIVRWASSGLAQRDLVHLTGPGYARLAGLLDERLMEAYERFRGGRTQGP